MLLQILLLSAAIVANGLQCGHKVNSTLTTTIPWTQNESLMETVRETKGVVPPTVVVDLDLPERERWVHVGQAYANRSDLIKEYFESLIPEWALKIIVSLAKDIVDYRGFGTFSDEMKGYAEGLGLDLYVRVRPRFSLSLTYSIVSFSRHVVCS